MKHTPGPWQLQQIGCGGVNNDIPVWDITGVNGARICTVAGDDALFIVESVNNAMQARVDVETSSAKARGK